MYHQNLSLNNKLSLKKYKYKNKLILIDLLCQKYHKEVLLVISHKLKKILQVLMIIRNFKTRCQRYKYKRDLRKLMRMTFLLFRRLKRLKRSNKKWKKLLIININLWLIISLTFLINYSIIRLLDMSAKLSTYFLRKIPQFTLSFC